MTEPLIVSWNTATTDTIAGWRIRMSSAASRRLARRSVVSRNSFTANSTPPCWPSLHRHTAWRPCAASFSRVTNMSSSAQSGRHTPRSSRGSAFSTCTITSGKSGSNRAREESASFICERCSRTSASLAATFASSCLTCSASLSVPCASSTTSSRSCLARSCWRRAFLDCFVAVLNSSTAASLLLLHAPEPSIDCCTISSSLAISQTTSLTRAIASISLALCSSSCRPALIRRWHGTPARKSLDCASNSACSAFPLRSIAAFTDTMCCLAPFAPEVNIGPKDFAAAACIAWSAASVSLAATSAPTRPAHSAYAPSAARARLRSPPAAASGSSASLVPIAFSPPCAAAYSTTHSVAAASARARPCSCCAAAPAHPVAAVVARVTACCCLPSSAAATESAALPPLTGKEASAARTTFERAESNTRE
mmetsp:Transcript_65327/g.156011  ORF Transcript_65327/g.156011 Transcript_65327/m.156011 type:complete len:424 (-) Transcript_65327:322-1593(-)